jgi:Fe2+ transport system protein FeoA
MGTWTFFRKSKRKTIEQHIQFLAELLPGQHGIISSIHEACTGMERRRLLDLGFVPGTPVEAAISSVFNDPVAYRVKGALIALRRQQANLIRIKPQ